MYLCLREKIKNRVSFLSQLELAQREKRQHEMKAFESFAKLSKASSSFSKALWQTITNLSEASLSFRKLRVRVFLGKATFENWSRAFESSVVKLVHLTWILICFQVEFWFYIWPKFLVIGFSFFGCKYETFCNQLYLVVNFFGIE